MGKERRIKNIKKNFQNHKIKIIFANKKIIMSESRGDIERMREFGFVYFDEERISYYYTLANHLGVASKISIIRKLIC